MLCLPTSSLSLFLTQEVDLFHAKPLAICSFEKAMEFPIGFDSHIPSMLKLAALPPGKTRSEESRRKREDDRERKKVRLLEIGRERNRKKEKRQK